MSFCAHSRPSASQTPPSSPRKSRYVPVKDRDRRVQLASWHPEQRAGALIIRVDDEADVYALVELALEPGVVGRAFRVAKRTPGCDTEASTYDVRIAGEASSCDCRGWLRFGACRHLDALAALVKAGKLTITTESLKAA